jgi:hypothetical protein
MIAGTITDLGDIPPDALPPRHHDGRLRILNVGLPILGLSSFSRALAEYASTRHDVVMTRFELVNTTWMKVLFRASPIPWSMDLQCSNMTRLWARRIRSAIDAGALDLGRFDAVVTCPQHHARAFIDRRPRGRPFVISAHTDATATNATRDFGDSALTMGPQHRDERFVFPRCDVVTCMGWFAGRSARDDYGVDPARLMLIPPTTTEIGEGTWHGRDAALGRPARIAIAGNDWERKGGPELLRWHQARWSERAQLHVFGHGAPVDPGARNVTWHGRVPRDRLIGELPSMDIFVLPTKRDMSPWVVVEAAGAGVATVATRVGGLADEVVHGETGYLCTPGNEDECIHAVETLLNDPERCLRMGRAAREFARCNFTPSVVYGGLVDRLWGEYRKQAGPSAA